MNTDLLQQRFDLLKQRDNVNLSAIQAIEQWVMANAQDVFKIHRIMPHVVAQDTQIPLSDIVPEFLYAVLGGLFDLNWNVHCPHCYGVTTSYQKLIQAHDVSYCKMCEVEFKADFAQRVEVTFSLNKAIDSREMPPICQPPDTVKIFYHMGAEYLQTVSGVEQIEQSGNYIYKCPLTGSKGKLIIAGEPTDVIQEVNLTQLANETFSPDRIDAHPGLLKINLTNLAYPLSGLQVHIIPLPELSLEHLPPQLSGLALFHYPEFRKLFGNQVLSQREQLQVASVTTLFTDITGSTQMYEKLGDATAYNIVRDHFEILFRQIERHGGIIIKTIGDAVMASFTRNDAALRSIFMVLQEFKQYNQTQPPECQVFIKVGIHCGTAILVNLNDKLDYFGSTINKAARIQAIASSDEICVSEQVCQDPNFANTLKELGIREISHHTVNLKGIDSVQTICKIMINKDKIIHL
ncbi:MAG: adenylate/guanylate cyclase domain-containing protein [Thiotrichaceae bacterium]